MTKRIERMNIPVRSDEKEMIDNAAKDSGETLASWVRRVALAAAKAALNKR